MNTQHTIAERILGDGLGVSVISFGAMGMSEFYGTPPEDEASLAVLDKALELGVTMIDTADMYGRGHNERLIAKFIARHPRERALGRIRVATKFGIDRDPEDSYRRNINNSPQYIRACCEASLKRLGIERIDLYFAHRINPEADLAETMGTLGDLKREGKIAHVGLCEVSARTLEKAHSLETVAAVQSEYSLWTRDVEMDILPLCKQLGIGFVAYSPLGRGFLTGRLPSADTLDQGDFRRSNPRFQGENLHRNASLLPTLEQVAARNECTPAQAALSWLLGRYEKLAAIPGTRSIARLEENCRSAGLRLHDDDVRLLDAVFIPEAVHGLRYSEEGMKGTGV